jgi:serine/threonine protein kinase
MSTFTPIDILRLWIATEGFPDWNLEDGNASGQYGIVFFLNSKHPNSFPPSLALKTLNPESLREKPTQLEELQREFSKWIRLPSHRNVLENYSFKTATVPLPGALDPEQTHLIRIPVISMERMNGTLGDWIAPGKIPLTAKLCALAQAFNGLCHLYSNGIQGHGDLKPSNILFKDISTTSVPGDCTWPPECPWVVKIADLGWADAWLDYGFTNKALREYMGPERFGDSPRVVPEKSDIFSMGIISAELLLGRHPCKKLDDAKNSVRGLTKCANAGNWDLSDLPSDRLKGFIKQCLDPSPEARPTAKEAVHLLCQELMDLIGVNIEPTLDYWSNECAQELFPFISARSEEIDRLMGTLGLGHEVEAQSIRRLRQIVRDRSMKLDRIADMQDWLQGASGLIDFLGSNESPLTSLEISQLRADARILVEKTFGKVNQQELDALTAGLDKKDMVTPFERYSDVLFGLAEVAHLDFEQCLKGEWEFSPLAIAGFALRRASSARIEANPARSPIEYLEIAIQHAPSQAEPYFLRALRRREALILAEIRELDPPSFSIQDVIADLERACRLAPDWKEPQTTLKGILNHP